MDAVDACIGACFGVLRRETACAADANARRTATGTEARETNHKVPKCHTRCAVKPDLEVRGYKTMWSVKSIRSSMSRYHQHTTDKRQTHGCSFTIRQAVDCTP